MLSVKDRLMQCVDSSHPMGVYVELYILVIRYVPVNRDVVENGGRSVRSQLEMAIKIQSYAHFVQSF